MKKRVIIFLLIALFIIAMSYSQSITVINPHGGENWIIGHTYTITWNSSGITGNVGIKLIQNGHSVGYLKGAMSVPNSGSYSWTIGELEQVGPITVGNNYQIQVKKSGVASGVSKGYFNISVKSSKNLKFKTPVYKYKFKTPNLNPIVNIKIISPEKSSIWTEGKVMKIIFANNNASGKYNIDLYDYYGEKKIRTIIKNLVHIGKGNIQYNWVIPKGIYKFPGNYRIKIYTISGNAKGMSEVFHIQKGKIIKKIIIKTPSEIKNEYIHKKSLSIGCVTESNWYLPWYKDSKSAIVGWQDKHLNPAIDCTFNEHFKRRSYIFFNLKDFKSGKRKIISAVLKFKIKKNIWISPTTVAHNGPSTGALSYIIILNSYWSNAFNVSGTKIKVSDSEKVNILKYLNNWLKGKNYGIMLVGGNESMSNKFGTYVTYYLPELEITYLATE